MEDKKQDKYLEKIDKQIESIENRINTLMEGVNDEDLTSAERMDFAIKLMGQHARFLALRKSSELAVPEGREKELLAIFMSRLRGEVVDG
jgi:hypothetical protein